MNASIRLSSSRRLLSLRPTVLPHTPHAQARANLQSIAFTAPRRLYATTPVKGAKPPITIHSLEGTYATALFSSSAANNAVLNEIEKSLSAIRQKLDADPKLQSAVTNPALSHNEKMDVIKFLTQVGGGGQDAARGVRNLLEVMSENGRLGQLDGVVSAFERIMRAHKGEVDVTVTSAQPLDNNALRRLEQSISKSSLITKGQKVKMQNKVLIPFCDETIIPSLSSASLCASPSSLSPLRDTY